MVTLVISTHRAIKPFHCTTCNRAIHACVTVRYGGGVLVTNLTLYNLKDSSVGLLCSGVDAIINSTEALKNSFS